MKNFFLKFIKFVLVDYRLNQVFPIHLEDQYLQDFFPIVTLNDSIFDTKRNTHPALSFLYFIRRHSGKLHPEIT